MRIGWLRKVVRTFTRGLGGEAFRVVGACRERMEMSH